jgi:hypothetical protein
MRSGVVPGALAIAVKPPCRVEPDASTTLAPGKGKQPRCIEEDV